MVILSISFRILNHPKPMNVEFWELQFSFAYLNKKVFQII